MRNEAEKEGNERRVKDERQGEGIENNKIRIIR